MGRGQLTDNIKDKYKITKEELRLMSYFQYCLVNSESIDPRSINQKEREILSRWEKEGKITKSCINGCSITKEFWDQMNEILYEAYAPKLEKDGEI